MLFFTSDSHHSEVLQRTTENGRPFVSPVEATNVMLENINQKCSESDTLFVLGDWANYTSYERDYWKTSLGFVRELRPHCLLVMGNNEQRILHDERIRLEDFRTFCRDLGWQDVYYQYTGCITFLGRRWSLAHKPTELRKDCLGLFGHVHKFGPITGIGINVGVDANHFAPISEVDIAIMLKTVNDYIKNDPPSKLIVGGEFSELW